MSDPVKNAEIEDVLSSIRRLVSGETRVAPETVAPRPRPVDRLVLTPALRVAEPSEPTEAVAPQADTLSDAGDQSGAAPWADPEATLYDAARGSHDRDEDQGEPQVDDSGNAAVQDDAAMAEADVDRDTDENWHHADEAGDDISAPKPDDLGARIAALEEVIAHQDENWEPDTAGADDYAGTEVETLEWEDSGDDAPVPEPEPEPRIDPQDDAETPDFLAEDRVLDEAALRELVADIVRQELQGALGERITRNVRKLVRREIQRAMTLQDLE